jgi:hypothetical protein
VREAKTAVRWIFHVFAPGENKKGAVGERRLRVSFFDCCGLVRGPLRTGLRDSNLMGTKPCRFGWFSPDSETESRDYVMVSVMVPTANRVAAGCRGREIRISYWGLPPGAGVVWFLSPVRLPVPPLQQEATSAAAIITYAFASRPRHREIMGYGRQKDEQEKGSNRSG